MDNTPKRYILLKDLPDAKAGDIYILRNPNGDTYVNEHTLTQKSPVIEHNSYFAWQVINTDWFEEVLPVSEPVPEKIKVLLFGFNEKAHGDTYYTMSFRTKNYIPIELCLKIKQAIESALNDTVVGDKGDGIDEITKLKNELKVTDELLNDRQLLLDAIPECEAHGKCVPHALDWIEIKKSKLYSEIEVDAIRAENFWTPELVAKIVAMAHRDGYEANSGEPFNVNVYIQAFIAKKEKTEFDTYLSSLNLNSNDTPIPSILMERENTESPNQKGIDFCSTIPKAKPTNDNTFIWHEMYPSPTKDDVNSQEFQAVWGAIKGWDIQRQKGVGYAGASGSDVMHILEALLPYFKQSKQSTPVVTDNSDVACLSLNDVKGMVNSYHLAELEKIAKQKLNK